MNPFSLEGKTILVTGATSGIGASTAIECAKAGARLVITGRNEERLNAIFSELQGDGHIKSVCELNDDTQTKSLVSSFSKLDGLVLCAGINQTLPISFFTRKKIDDVFNTNFFSPIELLRLIIKNKVLNKEASVVAVSSIGGNGSFSPGAAAYGASKAALLSWMKTAAKELAPKYRFNCICPGQVNTPMNAIGDITEEQYEMYRNSIPMKRFGEPQEIAYGIIYLLSDASRWVTGSALTIDGGTTL